MSAGGEELGAFVQGRTRVHYFHFFHQAQPTHLGGGSEGSGFGHGCPLDVEVIILVLQLPHIPEGGFHPLGAVLKVGLVVAIPGFPLRLGEADVVCVYIWGILVRLVMCVMVGHRKLKIEIIKLLTILC